jgi:hypothetical protein
MTKPSIYDCIKDIKYRHILVDTCFIVNYLRALRNKDCRDYDDFVSILKSNSNIFVTVYSVLLEYLKGEDILSNYRKKYDFFNTLIQSVLPIDPYLIDECKRMIILYRKEGKDISANDYLLATALKKYHKSEMLLLTSDHGDFPMKIFDRESIVPLQNISGGITTFALLKYSVTKGDKIYRDLLESNRKMQKQLKI